MTLRDVNAGAQYIIASFILYEEDPMTPNDNSVTPERIFQMAWGYAPPLILEAAIRHRIFDVLDNGPKSLSELQKDTGVSERGLSAIVNALVALDFFRRMAKAAFLWRPKAQPFSLARNPVFWAA